MLQYNPAIVITSGTLAERVVDRIQALIRKRCSLEVVPAIFQFVVLGKDQRRNSKQIAKSYAAALGKRAVAEAEELLRSNINISRVESFVIAPLQPHNYRLAFEASRELDRCALDSVSGGRNAIFLIAKRLLTLKRDLLASAAQSLNSNMQSAQFPFNRCFFIDDINEEGQTLDTQDDIVDLVSVFVSLALASELSSTLKDYPRPYMGEGQHQNAYASFSSSNMVLDIEGLIEGLALRLSNDITRHLFREVGQETVDHGLWERSRRWFRDNLDESLKDIKKRSAVGNLSSMEETDAKEDDSGQFFQAIYETSLIRLRALLDEAPHLFDFNLSTYREFLEVCLEHGITTLEDFSEQLRASKAVIADLLIKLLVAVPPIQENTRKYKREVRRSCLCGKRIRLVPVETVTTHSWEKLLKEKQEEYERKTGLLNVHLALFLRLDKACINLDRLLNSNQQLDKKAPVSIFDVNLVDEELQKRLYSSEEYKNKERDIKGFLTVDNFREFFEGLPKYPAVSPCTRLLEYCSSCFEFLREYDVAKFGKLTKPFKDLSAPFWKPLSSAGVEKLLLILSDDRSQHELRPLLESLTRATSAFCVDSQNPYGMTVVQISYGLELEEMSLTQRIVSDFDIKSSGVHVGNDRGA